MNSLKSQTELNVCENFLSVYNSSSQEKLEFVRFGDPVRSEPDCICSNNTGIEVVGNYDNEYQAEKIWASARKKKSRKAYQPRLFSLDSLEQKVSGKLAKLENGNYSGHSGRIMLVCRLYSPLIETKEIHNFIEQYVPFKEDAYFETYFDEIWITWEERGGGLKTARLE